MGNGQQEGFRVQEGIDGNASGFWPLRETQQREVLVVCPVGHPDQSAAVRHGAVLYT